MPTNEEIAEAVRVLMEQNKYSLSISLAPRKQGKYDKWTEFMTEDPSCDEPLYIMGVYNDEEPTMFTGKLSEDNALQHALEWLEGET